MTTFLDDVTVDVFDHLQYIAYRGVGLDQLDSSSRHIYRVPDAPYVFKLCALPFCEFDDTCAPCQSWAEHYSWQNVLRDHELSDLFAATHEYRSWECDDYYVGVSVQDLVTDGGTALRGVRAYHGARDCTRRVEDSDLPISDFDASQCMFDARRGHYVVVDYGMWRSAPTDEWLRAWERARDGGGPPFGNR